MRQLQAESAAWRHHHIYHFDLFDLIRFAMLIKCHFDLFDLIRYAHQMFFYHRI